jgi:REP element-mobilizing transposase RayT
LGNVVRAFKSISAISINRALDRQGIPLWQRNYYERVIRDEQELTAIRQYIVDNPARWNDDENHPARV